MNHLRFAVLLSAASSCALVTEHASAAELSSHLELVRRGVRTLSFDASSSLAVALRFVRRPTDAELASFRAHGIDVRPEPLVTGAYLAKAAPEALERLRNDPLVRRVESASPRLLLEDADVVSATGVADATRAVLGDRSLWIDGSGVTVGDVDSDAFVFHPSLFRADAGAFAWIDVDGNGTFEPGVDAIDLDRDGAPSDGETSALLRMEMRDFEFQTFDDREGFDATRDYVFLDTNGNGARDFGAGFAEDTPAFGEPLFVPDDANGNGVLDPSERLLRLGTTKFSKVYARGTVYTRGGAGHLGILGYGKDLISDRRAAEHGTYMTAILAGGNGSNRYRGR